jgi:hypothetical protein
MIGEIAFSRRFGFIEAGRDDGILKNIETAFAASTGWVAHIPWIIHLDNFFAPLTGNRLGTKTSFGDSARIRGSRGRES